MNDIVQAVMITAASGILGPVILAIVNAKNARRVATTLRAAQLEDYARQDLVAAKVDEAARLTRLAARKADDVATAQAAISADLQGGMRQIHTLVNDNLTAMHEKVLKQALGRLVALKRLSPQTSEDLAEIFATEAVIRETRAVLKDRAVQLQLVETEINSAASSNDRPNQHSN